MSTPEEAAAVLPHLRVQETPAPGELHKALEKALDDELCTCEQCEDGDKYNDGVRSVIKAVQAVLSAHPAPTPRPVVDREALVTEVVAKFHVLHPRIPDLDKGDCHCELLAQLAADAVLALPPTEEGGGSAVCTCRTIAPSGWDTVQQVVNPRCPLHAEDSTKALVETGTKLGYELGRKEAGEQIAAAIIARRDADDSTREFRSGLGAGATIAANLFSQPNHAAPAGLTGAPASAGTPEDSRAGGIRIPAPDLTKGGQ